MLPTFMGIGAPKAGTTWLYQCLSEHPDVFMAPSKDTRFFEYQSVDNRIAEYEAYFSGAEGFNAVGDFSVNYLPSAKAPQRISEYLPSVRLLVSLRNPIDQVYSHYWHLSRQCFHQSGVSRQQPTSFEDALNLYREKLIQPALYFSHLQRWLKHFDSSQLLILLYDDICSKPLNVLRTVFAFIGVNPDFTPKSLEERGTSVRQGVSYRNALMQSIHASLYTRLNRRVYRPLKDLIGPRRAERLKDWLRVRAMMQVLFFRKGYPPMNAETRERLRLQFSVEIQGLSDLTGVDLSHWR